MYFREQKLQFGLRGVEKQSSKYILYCSMTYLHSHSVFGGCKPLIYNFFLLAHQSFYNANHAAERHKDTGVSIAHHG